MCDILCVVDIDDDADSTADPSPDLCPCFNKINLQLTVGNANRRERPKSPACCDEVVV